MSLRKELTRRANNRDRVLAALIDAGPRGVTNIELMQIGGVRAGARIDELRKLGHTIPDAVHEHDGVYRYTLVTPETATELPAAMPETFTPPAWMKTYPSTPKAPAGRRGAFEVNGRLF